MTKLHLDFETFSELDLTQVGTSRYAKHPSTEVLMCAWAVDNEPVRLFDLHEGDGFPAEWLEAMADPGVRKIAWNTTFEKAILCHVLGMEVRPEEWTDPMVVAYSLALPGSLDQCAKVLRLPPHFQKDARGKRLIQKFSKPRKPTKNIPRTRNTSDSDWFDYLDFQNYCRQDVEVEREVFKKIRKWDLGPDEYEAWLLDQEINNAGIPINLDMVENARKIRDHVISRKLNEMREITRLGNPNSTKQLLPWLQDHGYAYDDLKAGHVRQALARAEAESEAGDVGQNFLTFHEDYRNVLGLRLETSKTSITKFDALSRATDDDGNLRYTIQFAGAGRTNRFAGRIFQPQNLARPHKNFEDPDRMAALARHVEKLSPEDFELVYGDPITALSSAVRPAVQAPPGYVLIDVDLSAIENIVLGYMAEERKILTVFERGRDPYLDFAQYLYTKLYDELLAEFEAGDKKKRTISKPGVLGCGYQLGAGFTFENEKSGEIEATGLLGYAWNMGIKDFTQADSEASVRTWRNTFTDAVAFWGKIEKAAKRAICTGRTTEAGPVSFYLDGPFLKMRLPSGRCLSYCRPRVEPKPTPWGEVRDTVTYEGLNDKKQWTRLTTHPGKLTENADQAIARDILVEGMMLARREGINIRLHVHDQAVATVSEDDADRQLAVLKECLTTKPEWAPTIPLQAGGFKSPVFMKD